ncbi:hypothetical protein RCJ22_29820 [Vibrio sp. FNV 38]|nr:hypothetical protein [Vibrio sp. FNV 38]
MKAVCLGVSSILLVGGSVVHANEPYYLGDLNSSVLPAWDQIDTTGITFLPNSESYPILVPNDIKARYQNEQALLTDVRWTFEAIHQMYPTEWEAQPNTETEAGRQEAIAFLLTDVACESLPASEPISEYFEGETEGSVQNLELDSCLQNENKATYRLRTFVPTVPGATYAYEVKYRQVEPETDSNEWESGGWYNLIKKWKSKWRKFSWDDWGRGDSYTGWLSKGWSDKKSSHRRGKGLGHCKNEHKTNSAHKYAYFRHHHWHHHHQCEESEKIASPNLFLRVSGHLNYLPTEQQDSDIIEDGFITKTLIYTADDFYTPIYTSKDGVLGSNPVLLKSLSATEIASNARESECLSYYAENSSGAKNCLIGDTEPERLGCDLSEAVLAWREGTLDMAEIGTFNTTEENVFSTDSSEYLALGEGGDLVIRIRDNGYRAACPVEGKTLALEELGETQEIEVGLVKVRFALCDNDALNGVYTLLSNQSNLDALTFTGGQAFSHTFGEGFEGCGVEDIRIQDGRGIYGVGAGDPYDGTGIDVYRVSLTSQ